MDQSLKNFVVCLVRSPVRLIRSKPRLCTLQKWGRM
ncbi:hypothetical protein AALP_AA3G208000 [Arabis alpina]|uniref:Uncharacterized protein n=1 Tax=Arabis alpina TaxID=50452 RepID=A0A087HAK8_ARAAL|nr:hypothetical protein AALP_AA3G208000 [Arabis alpina]